MTEMQGGAGKPNRDSTLSQMGSHEFVCSVYHNATNFVSHMTYTQSRMLFVKLCFCLAFACLTILSKLTVCGQKTRAYICNCLQNGFVANFLDYTGIQRKKMQTCTHHISAWS